MHKNGKWARQILSLQDEEGKWGCFHSLSQSYGSPMTTEQALRRLEILGFTMDDFCISRAVAYMEDCLTGRKTIPDRREKVSDWDVFCNLILSTWIRRFTCDCEIANSVAKQWANIIAAAFSGGYYDHGKYVDAYHRILNPKYGRINSFAMFYPISLLQGELDEDTERAMIRFLLKHESGIYYIHDRPLSILPAKFDSREASRYLYAIELLVDYPTARENLKFVSDWLLSNQNSNGKWDMGTAVNDRVFFPLSDDWRKAGSREADCTERIEAILCKLHA